MKSRKKKKEFYTEYTARNALKNGSFIVRLSAIVFGLGCLVHKQIAKGILYLTSEILLIVYMVQTGFYNLSKFRTLGDVEQQKVWNEAKSLYEYVDGDRSLIILLYGIVTLSLILVFFLIAKSSLKQAYRLECQSKKGEQILTLKQELKELLNGNLHITLLTFPVLGVLMFTILPLVFMISMAFTNYSKIDNHLMLFDWVGLDNFKTLFDSESILGSTFWSVLGWTIIWAFFATFSNYIFGMILSLLINRKGTKAKGFWRFCFVLSCAVPMFVSLLIMRTMLQPEGAVNVLLRNIGLIASDASLPFFTDATWARVTVIIINVWVGVPYTLLQLTGVLQNIPEELYEAAKVDGANAFQTFTKITLPYMLYVTTPYLIVTFTGNVNNFNVIYLLSGGDPVTNLSSTAGKTDLLVTWLYKLTIDKQYYNIGAVIGIMTFIILAIGCLLTYRNSKSYKEEGGF